MSLCDPVADMLTRIRNAHMADHLSVKISYSKMNLAVVSVLKQEGYIEGFEITEKQKKEGRNPILLIVIALKYYNGSAVIDRIVRVSRPGLRVYKKASELQPVLNGLGIAIISTSQGVMTDKMAREKKLGGELLCIVA